MANNFETKSDFQTEEFENTNFAFHLCIICQKEKNETLVEKPSVYEKVLNFIEEWAKYGNLNFSEIWKKLRNISPQELEINHASWHRSCYKDAIHTGMLKRAKERYVVVHIILIFSLTFFTEKLVSF